MKRERLKARLERLYARLDRRFGGALSLLVRTALAFVQDNGPLAARSIAYYAVFAVFPAMLALIVVASAALGSEEARGSVMALVEQHAPLAYGVVSANIEQLLEMSGSVGLIALVGLIWSASGVASALFQAVNRAWGVQSPRLVLSARLYSLAMIFVVAAILLLALAIGPLVNLARAWQVPVAGWQPSAQPGTDRLVSWLSALAPAFFAVCAFILVYRTMPRARVEWRDVWLGGVIAGLIWEAGQQIFIWYVSNVANYNAIYGSVGVIIAFLLWCYLSSEIILLGAEFTAEYSRWRRAGRPMETRPLSEWMAGWSRKSEIEAGASSGADRTGA
jgi:membrane protein